MTRLTIAAILAVGILAGLGLAALATAHTWPEWDERATDYDMEGL